MTGIADLRVSPFEGDAPAEREGVLEAVGDGWTGRFERMNFGPTFRMSMGRFDVTAPTDLPAAPIGDRPLAIAAVTVVTGQATLRLQDGREVALSPSRAVLLRTSGVQGAFHLPGSQVVRYFGASIAPELMVSLLEGAVPADLAPFVTEPAGPAVLLEKRIGPATQALIKKLGNPRQPGALNRLHREVVALQFLTEILQPAAETDEPGAMTLTPQEELAILAALEPLLADLRNPPPAAVLAAGAGIKLRRFLKAFEAVHGASPAQRLRLERLDRARQLLEAGVSLKQIAWRVGYNHANNFIAAFTDRFGLPPRQFLRQG